MYKRYRNELVSYPSIKPHKDIRMRKMLKKIDRKIDERLAASIK